MAELKQTGRRYLDKLLHGISRRHRGQLAVLLGLPLVVAVLAVSIQLTQQQVRQRVEASGAELSFTGSAASDVADTPELEVEANETAKLFMMMNTKGEKVTAVDLRIKYDDTKLELLPAGRVNPEKFGLLAVKEGDSGQVIVFGAPDAGVSWSGVLSLGNLQFKWKPEVAVGGRATVEYELSKYAVVEQTVEPQTAGAVRGIELVKVAAAEVPPTSTPTPTITPTPVPAKPKLVVQQGRVTQETGRYGVYPGDHVVYQAAQQTAPTSEWQRDVKVVITDSSQLSEAAIDNAESCGAIGGSRWDKDTGVCTLTIQPRQGWEGKYLLFFTELVRKPSAGRWVSCTWQSRWKWRQADGGRGEMGIDCVNDQPPALVQKIYPADQKPTATPVPSAEACWIDAPATVRAGEQVGITIRGKLDDAGGVINRWVLMYEGDVGHGGYDSGEVGANAFRDIGLMHTYSQAGVYNIRLLYQYDNSSKQVFCERRIEVSQ